MVCIYRLQHTFPPFVPGAEGQTRPSLLVLFQDSWTLKVGSRGCIEGHVTLTCPFLEGESFKWPWQILW